MTGLVELARTIERSSYRSWKARECVQYDGWELRYADGFSRRGNSVFPAGRSQLPYEEKLAWCRGWYADRGLDLVVRQTVATEPGLDEMLADLGFTLEGHTDVMIGECRATAGDLPVQSAPGTDWWTTAAALWQFDPAGVAGWQGIVSRIDKPAGFVCVPGTAAGMAICDGSWLGLFEIIVAPESRRQGLGRGVTESLLSWGSGQGAGRAYLQVVAENEDAIRFYQSLGFSRAYGYWYRRDQAANKPA